MHTRGKVPHFTMRPNPGMTALFFFVLLVGLLLALSFLSREEGVGQYRQRAILTLSITGVFCTCLAIIATSKMWFRHLWKRNSSHNRHKQHTQHHPTYKNTPPRRR